MKHTAVEGLFEIARLASGRRAGADQRMFLICRDGRLFGADPAGTVYTGELRMRSSAAAKPRLEAACEAHGGRARLRSGSKTTGVFIWGEIDPSAERQNTTILVGRKPVEIEITYLGPLPQ
jgi:hypothetical protein